VLHNMVFCPQFMAGVLQNLHEVRPDPGFHLPIVPETATTNGFAVV
jgi:hypothetical protein